jgi:8-oxo-dGTP pyrophosphatase MutT (NUDIX family)
MEKACGCIVINGDKVLIEKQLSGFYGFPKGHIENGETEEECAIRETFEEVGVRARVDSNLRFTINYVVHGTIPKEVVFFVSFLEGDSLIHIQEEEVEDAFWVDIDKVYDILTFDNLKEMWSEAYNKYKEVYNGKVKF